MPDRLSTTARTGRSVIFGTAGHIDHGKTALIRALTGIDTDRLPEEKRRGITIDIGFACLDAQMPDGSPLRLSFVDVPGHARFVRNMLAGAGGIDAVLMVISAEEGVMPQTEEHLAICSLLGIERGLTVLTKADAVSEERLIETTQAVRRFISGTLLGGGPVIAVSACSGSGIEELRRELIRMAANIPKRRSDTVLRLPIDRAFVMKGFGTVVTGTLMGGSIRSGDELAILPGGRTTRVRGVQVHGRAEEAATAGSRAALNLTHVDAAEVRRGEMLVKPSSLHAVDVVDVELSILQGALPLKHRARLHFHAFASECIATANLYETTLVSPGETGLARMRLAEALVVLPGDRFVLRAGTPMTTIGGGSVLDAHPAARMRKAKAAEWLHRLRAASPEERIWLRIARRRVQGISVNELCAETGIMEGALSELLERLIREGRVHSAGERFFTKESFAAARETIRERLGARSGSASSDIRRSELREQTGLGSGLFDEVLRTLQKERQLEIVCDFVVPNGADGESGRDGDLIATIAAEYERAGIAPPSPDELGTRLGIASGEMRRLITLLLRGGTLVRLGDDSLCMHQSAIAQLREKIRSLRGQTLDIAAFKQVAGVSRKYAIPLLEYLDRQRITVKQGSQRRVL
jgi:selenocysteine-specific elongation factor